MIKAAFWIVFKYKTFTFKGTVARRLLWFLICDLIDSLSINWMGMCCCCGSCPCRWWWWWTGDDDVDGWTDGRTVGWLDGECVYFVDFFAIAALVPPQLYLHVFLSLSAIFANNFFYPFLCWAVCCGHLFDVIWPSNLCIYTHTYYTRIPSLETG